MMWLGYEKKYRSSGSGWKIDLSEDTDPFKSLFLYSDDQEVM